MLLVADLLNLLILTPLRELATALEALGLETKQKRLSQYLYLLEQLGLALPVSYSNQTYYGYPGARRFVRYAYKLKDAQRDRRRWQLDFRNWYRANDRKRALALRDYVERTVEDTVQDGQRPAKW